MEEGFLGSCASPTAGKNAVASYAIAEGRTSDDGAGESAPGEGARGRAPCDSNSRALDKHCGGNWVGLSGEGRGSGRRVRSDELSSKWSACLVTSAEDHR